ncbi:MAG TPA: hypothetical protein VEU08_23885 [Vicinamibacterales bacterium]|nr:hypothetical protein [Vicinamibacterales bacterium]
MPGVHVKVTINGKEYTSLDDVPEPLRHLIEKRMAAAAGGLVTGTTTVMLKSATGDFPFELQPRLLAPAEYRSQIEAQQTGSAPEAFPGEPQLGIALGAVIALSVAGFVIAASGGSFGPVIAIPRSAIPVFFIASAASFLGLIGLLYRHQNRALYPVLLDLADRVPGAFVAVIGGRGRLFVARDAWHGAARFDPGSKYSPSYSRVDAQIGPSSLQLEIHSRSVLARLASAVVAPAGTGTTTGDAGFDTHFAVACADESFVGKFLDDDVRDALNRLRGFGELSVTIRGNAVRVNVHRDLAQMHRRSRRGRDEDTLERFLTDACAVVDAAASRSR